MGFDRPRERTTASVERRPAASALTNRSTASAAPQSPVQRLQQRLGNQGTLAFFNRLSKGDSAASAMAGAVANARSEMLSQMTERSGALAPPLRHQPLGDAAGQRNLGPRSIQTKLTISHPGDMHEQEAERVADQVMRMAEPPPQDPSVSPLRAVPPAPSVHRLCAECEEEMLPDHKPPMAGDNGARVQRKEEFASVPEVSPSVSANIHALQSGGSPLPAATRAFFEPRFDADFSQVRLHTGTRAEETAKAINAKAFTLGSDIAFAGGQYAPDSHEGRKLLAHELTHVVQQNAPSSSWRVQRQPSTGGMTSTSAPASVPATTPGPIASIPTAADTQTRDLIKKALESRDAADVKKVKNFAAASQAEKFELIRILLNQGWVGPYDEYALEDIWKTFGDGVVTVASANFDLWNECIERGAELDDLPAVAKLKKKFESDIKEVVTGYLLQNRELVMNEMQRLGIPAEDAPLPTPTLEQTDEIEKMQRAAAEVAKLQRAQEEARTIYVGYKGQTVLNPQGPGAAMTTVPVKFDPYKPPESTSPPSLFSPGVEVEIKPYQDIKEKYDKASKSIEGFLNLYPSLYAISREGQSATTAAFAAVPSSAKARDQLGVAMRKLLHDIEATQAKLNDGDLNPLDLTPIHDQLLGGLNAPSGIDWRLRLPESVAENMVKGHQFREALKALGLQTAAMALFMLAPFTGGASIYVMLAGLAVTRVKLYLSTEQYENLAQAAKTSPKPGTELVTRGQVDEAKMEMEADQIAVALAALAVGIAVAVKIIGAIKGPAPSKGEVPPRTLTIPERLANFFSRLRAKPNATTADEAFAQIRDTLNQVEDESSGVVRKDPPPPINEPDGRMYPPQEDFTKRNPDGSIDAITRGHKIHIERDGSITITNRRTGNIDFQKPGGR